MVHLFELPKSACSLCKEGPLKGYSLVYHPTGDRHASLEQCNLAVSLGIRSGLAQTWDFFLGPKHNG